MLCSPCGVVVSKITQSVVLKMKKYNWKLQPFEMCPFSRRRREISLDKVWFSGFDERFGCRLKPSPQIRQWSVNYRQHNNFCFGA